MIKKMAIYNKDGVSYGHKLTLAVVLVTKLLPFLYVPAVLSFVSATNTAIKQAVKTLASRVHISSYPDKVRSQCTR